MKNFKLRILCLAISVFAGLNVSAQVTFNVDWTMMDARSDNYIADRYDDVNGNPYLLNDWAKGSVTSGQAVLKDQMLKFDEVENRVLVKGEDGSMKTFKSVINRFTILDKSKERHFSSGFIKGNDNDNFTFFEVLADGKVKLLKRNIKVISVNKEYSGKQVKNVTSETKFYIGIPGRPPVTIKLNESTILSELSDKRTQLEQYVKSNKLNLKKEDDAAKLISYYNSI